MKNKLNLVKLNEKELNNVLGGADVEIHLGKKINICIGCGCNDNNSNARNSRRNQGADR